MTSPDSPAVDTSRDACPSPHSSRNKLGRLFWGCVWWTMFRISPRPLFAWRRILLRLFGAEIAANARIDGSARIWAPWNLSLGRDASIGPHADIYNVAKVSIGDYATVSQYACLCTATHDVSDPSMKFLSSPIVIETQAWVCAGAWVLPGVDLKAGAVAGARSVVTKTVPEWAIVAGNPARYLRQREINTTPNSN